MTSSTDPARLVPVTPATLRSWPLPLPGESKDARGRLLVAGGTRSTPGAVRLAGEAALRAGAGKLRLATVGSTMASLGVAVPESATLPLPETEDGALDVAGAVPLAEEAQRADAALFGTGFTDPDASVAVLSAVLPEVRTPIVLDALGSAYLVAHPDGLRHLEGRAVATLNLSEVAHTAGCVPDEVEADPAGVAGSVAERSRLVVVCGGTAKHVVAPDGRCWVVEGGGPGLGVSGSGDVLAGIVAGLLARGADPAQAAVWGSALHARVGEMLAARVGTVGYLARDLPERVPAALTELS